MALDKDAFAKAAAQMLVTYSEYFDKLAQERFAQGAAEYGPFTFLENDVVRMMAEELVDTANYCRMQFVKLMMLQDQLVEEIAKYNAEAASEGFGINSFKGAKDGWK